MNIIACQQKWDLQQAFRNRRDRILAHREKVISRRPRFDIKSIRTLARNGRIVTEFTIDGSREFGRGFSYKLFCGAGA